MPDRIRQSRSRSQKSRLLALGALYASSFLLSAATASGLGGLLQAQASQQQANFFETVLEGGSASQKSCKPTGLIQDACCDYQTVEAVNADLAAKLGDIVQLPFFRYQKVDLFRDCPFWHEDGSCMNRACAVQETEEEHIPEAWRSGTLGKIKEAVQFPHSLEGALFRDQDFCVLDEESPSSEGVYVDLFENPERFTGYAGASANKVWKAIYEENCFGVVPFLPPSRSAESGGSGYVGTSLLQDRSQGVRNLMGTLGLAAPRDPQDEEMCLEKRVFYRLISGLHASISIHICSEYLDQETGEWQPNLACFITRIAEHPERLQNVYFNYVMMLRALAKAAPYLRTLDYSTGDKTLDTQTKSLVDGLLTQAESCTATFDETSMFSGPEAKILKDEFKSHFRNVSRIMDCVGCDKCRLWGKTQVTGVATGLKLLFSFDDAESSAVASDFSLRRSEIVAFMWTIHRFSESLAAVEQFRDMWAVRSKEERRDPAKSVRAPTAEELKEDAVEKPLKQDQTEGIELAEPEIFAPLVSPNSELVTPPRRTVNSSSHHGTTSVGPRISGMLEKLYVACRSSIAACLTLVESALAFVASSFGTSASSKSDL